MTSYRVVSEPYGESRNFLPRHRSLRGNPEVQHRVTIVDAPDIVVALSTTLASGYHIGRSITSMEEVLPAGALYFSDEELTLALRQPEGGTPASEPDKLDPDAFEDRIIYETVVFNDTVEEVAKVLRETLLPGLFLTVIGSDDGDHSALLEVRDEATGSYRSTTAEMKSLIQDHSATGWDGALSIAQAIINTVSPLL